MLQEMHLSIGHQPSEGSPRTLGERTKAQKTVAALLSVLNGTIGRTSSDNCVNKDKHHSEQPQNEDKETYLYEFHRAY